MYVPSKAQSAAELESWPVDDSILEYCSSTAQRRRGQRKTGITTAISFVPPFLFVRVVVALGFNIFFKQDSQHIDHTHTGFFGHGRTANDPGGMSVGDTPNL